MQNGEKVFLEFLNTQAFFKKLGVTALDKVLYCIMSGRASPKAVMDFLGLSKGNLANYCKTLIRKDLIISHRDTTTRGIYYTTTDKGQQTIQALLAKITKLSNES
jgi:DNA-binding MarR family transcriptional regulator